jgi:hypothetical protein
MWRLIKGRRVYLINREPHSTHLTLLEKRGFDVICNLRIIDKSSSIKRADLAPRYRGMSDDDLITSGAYIQAVKGG